MKIVRLNDAGLGGGQPAPPGPGGEEGLGPGEGLVNNVGDSKLAKCEERLEQQWDGLWQRDVMGYVGGIQAVRRGRRERGRGVIGIVASTAGKRPSAGMPNYTVTKAAVLSLSRLVADLYAKDGIRCNAIAPGPTSTETWLGPGRLADQQAEQSGKSREEVLQSVGAGRPIGRLAEPEEIAAVIVEPVAGNMGCVLPAKGYLEHLRKITEREKSVLIFDEVMTGFRVAFGGAQELFAIKPDLTALGKIIGGGLPVGAYGGRSEILNLVAPLGPMYQAGTLLGNPLAIAAGLATLQHLRVQKQEFYSRLEKLSEELVAGVAAAAKDAGVPICHNRVGSMFTWFFTRGPVTDWASASKADTKAFGRFFHAMLDNGVYLPPSQFEAAFLSLAHTDAEVDEAAEAAGEVLSTS